MLWHTESSRQVLCEALHLSQRRRWVCAHAHSYIQLTLATENSIQRNISTLVRIDYFRFSHALAPFLSFSFNFTSFLWCTVYTPFHVLQSQGGEWVVDMHDIRTDFSSKRYHFESLWIEVLTRSKMNICKFVIGFVLFTLLHAVHGKYLFISLIYAIRDLMISFLYHWNGTK